MLSVKHMNRNGMKWYCSNADTLHNREHLSKSVSFRSLHSAILMHTIQAEDPPQQESEEQKDR